MTCRGMGSNIEIDVYHGSNKGVVVAEVEFGSEQECDLSGPRTGLAKK